MISGDNVKNKNITYLMGSIFIIVLIILVFVIVNMNKKNFILFPDNNIYLLRGNKVVKYTGNIEKEVPIMLMNDGLEKLTFKYNDKKITFYKDNAIYETNFKYAYTSNVDITENQYQKQELDNNDLIILKKVLTDHNISGYDELYINYKVNINGMTIYFISNLYEELGHDKVFSFVYYLDNNEIKYLIDQTKPTDEALDLCRPSFNSYLNINNADNFVIDCMYYSNNGSDNFIYKFVNNDIIKIK